MGTREDGAVLASDTSNRRVVYTAPAEAQSGEKCKVEDLANILQLTIIPKVQPVYELLQR